MGATAFKVHPYHHDTIGWKTDLETMTRDDLYEHYKTFYAPNNAVIVAAGDFYVDDMLGRIRKSFGSIPRGPAAPPVKVVEPPQEGERRVHLRRPGPTSYFHAALPWTESERSGFLSGLCSRRRAVRCWRNEFLRRRQSGTLVAVSTARWSRRNLPPMWTVVFGRPSTRARSMRAATVRPGIPVEKVERAILRNWTRSRANR